MSVLPTASKRWSALRVARAVWTLPKVVVRPSTSSSGDLSATKMAIASSIPGSVSMIIFFFPSPPAFAAPAIDEREGERRRPAADWSK
uniref:Uncharacterized protein n=1 Tax=Arundo donax TaxID=35708 RepID=A0A0A9B039_ARUDO